MRMLVPRCGAVTPIPNELAAKSDRPLLELGQEEEGEHFPTASHPTLTLTACSAHTNDTVSSPYASFNLLVYDFAEVEWQGVGGRGAGERGSRGDEEVRR
jgi:hypothetical protein